MQVKYIITGLFLIYFNGCGGSSSSPQSSGNIILSGKITYDFVPVNSNNIGLDYSDIQQKSVKKVQVDAINSANQIIASTISDGGGNYSFPIPNNTKIKIRVLAKIVNSGIASWNVEIVDNTNSNALYVMEGSLVSTGLSDETRNLNASSGWAGNSYTSSRVAAPFAILDNVYKSIQKVLSANPRTAFPPLIINWSVNNVPATGEPSLGQITTSHYTNGNLFILGDADTDTDEYDTHIIVHEWAHYYEDKLSRSDSIGGPHAFGDRLDIRVAFSEGFANAFSGMVLDDPVYFDTLGVGQANGFSFNLENQVQNNPGWYSGASVQRILYDLYDANSDGSDTLSMGFTPLHEIMIGTQKITPVFTSIFTFISLLKNENMADASSIDSLVASERIAAITGIYGFGRTNLASELPEYTDLSIGSTVNVCPSYTYGNINKLGNRRYIKFSVNTEGHYTIRVSKSTGVSATDPDFLLYATSLIGQGFSEVVDSEEQRVFLNTGNYKLDISDFKQVVAACFNVTINN